MKLPETCREGVSHGRSEYSVIKSAAYIRAAYMRTSIFLLRDAEHFKGLAACGGFSFGDVLGGGEG